MDQELINNSSEVAWTLLSNAIGNYFGMGLNHQGQKYEGHCCLKREIPTKLIAVTSQAKGINGEVFHNEISWIGRDISGALTLYVNSNNHPGITPHVFDRVDEGQDGSRKVVFRFGKLSDKHTFREEVTFGIHTNYNIEHTYAWGLPGGSFETRSSARMKKIV